MTFLRSTLVLAWAASALACGHAADLALDPGGLSTGDASADAAPDQLGRDADGSTLTVDMFDDFEDGDLDVNAAGGRFGHWYNYADGTDGTNTIAVVTLDPQTERHPTYQATSKMALRAQAAGYTTWGSGYSADVAASSPYDLSAYTGLIFWTKNLTSQSVSIRVALPDSTSDPRGGKCDKSPDAAKEIACYDPFAKDVVLLPGDWQVHMLPFWTLRQGGWGLKAESFAVREVFAVAVGQNTSVTYDYYIDDIGFYIE